MSDTIKKTTNKKKILISIVAALIIILLTFPFALNFYLNKKLPDIINEKTDYRLQLEQLDLDLFSGDLEVQNAKLINKNPKDTTATQINASVGQLSIKNFSLWKALFYKQYHAQSLVLINPDIAVTLSSKKKDNTKSKNKQDLFLENVLVENANVKVLKSNGKPLFNGKDVSIKLTEIKQSEDDSKIPFAFKDFKINAKDVVVTPDEFYTIQAKSIDAKNKSLSVHNFSLKPTRNIKEFEAKNVFDFVAESFDANDFNISPDSLIVNQIKFVKPELKLTATGKRIVEKKKEKESDIKVSLKNIDLQDGKILVLQHNLQKSVSVDQFSFSLKDFIFDKQTAKEKIPFHFKNPHLDAKQVFVKTDAYNALHMAEISNSGNDITVNQLKMIPLIKRPNKDVIDFSTEKVLIHKNLTNFAGQKLNLNIDGIDVVNPKVRLYSAKTKTKTNAKTKKTTDFSFFAHVRKINVINGDFKQFAHGKEKLSADKIAIQLDDVKTDSKTIQQDFPAIIKSHQLTANNIKIDAGRYYNLTLASIHNAGKITTVKSLAFLPKYSRAGFSKVISVEEDLYTIRAKLIKITDKNSSFGKNSIIHLDNVLLDGVNCNIYHDLAPPDDNSIRYFFSKKLRDVKIPLFVNTVNIKNSFLAYEENAENANIPGKLTFDKFDANISNVNNAKIKGLSTVVNVDANFLFFGTASTKVNWKFDVTDMQDRFAIVGNISKLSADNVNLFVRPYLNISIDGKIDYVKFDFNGDNKEIGGKFYFKYKDIYVNFLNKNNGKERKLLSKVANWFIKDESTGEPEHVNIKKKRDPTRSFFNMLWQGIMEGLKKYLI